MKNKLIKILVVVLTLSIACFTFACSEQEEQTIRHTHEYSTQYYYDHNSHWVECLCEKTRK